MGNLNEVKDSLLKIELGGKERSVKYDLNALAILEETIGSIQNLDSYIYGENGISITAIRKVLWAGLVHENEELTEKEVGSWFDIRSIEKISTIIQQALSESMPASDGDDKGEKKTEQTQD